MQSTMQDFPLTITAIFRHGRNVHSGSEVATFEGETSRRATFAEVADRTDRLAAALRRLGIGPGDRVGTFAWNTQEHLEAYLAVPCMGAVLHTLNLRLFPDQLTYIVNHAEDRVILVDGTLIPLLARVAKDLKTVEHFVVIGPGDTGPLGETLSYEELLAAESPGYDWPELDERSAAAMCYTSGTTGNPKGVVYSHRSTFLHSIAECTGSVFNISDGDRILPIVPMFHANAWGLPYAGWLAGADFVMPGRFLQGEPMCKLIETERPTISGAVPTVWNDILNYAEKNPVDLSSLRMVACGGAAVPRSLIEAFEQKHGVRIIQAWGMTETSPLAAIAHPPKGRPSEEEMDWRAKTGRVVGGVELRIVADDGRVLPWDGEAVGEIEVRGPWITASYYKDDDPAKFHDGWLRTGDVGLVDPQGFVQITDRAKDVIKSGGEWISSIDIENFAIGHPDVAEAAVIGVQHPKWDERPLLIVVPKEGRQPTKADLLAFLEDRIAKWWLPDDVAFVDALPHTATGKIQKTALRDMFRDYRLPGA